MTYRLSTPFDPRQLGDQCIELATGESALEVYDREGVKAHTHGREGTPGGGGGGKERRSNGGSARNRKRAETPPAGGFGGMLNKCVSKHPLSTHPLSTIPWTDYS